MNPISRLYDFHNRPQNPKHADNGVDRERNKRKRDPKNETSYYGKHR